MAPGDATPVDIPALIGIERARLLELLATLEADDWQRQTPCPEWDVLDLCGHLVGIDLSSLSRHRDHYSGTRPPGGLSEAGFIEWIDELQMEWVRAARRLSPPVVVDLLAWAGPQLVDMFGEEDPNALTAHVSWAGPDPLPAWLDQRRELSEYWIHRQQLLESLGRVADLRPELAGPVLDGLRWATRSGSKRWKPPPTTPWWWISPALARFPGTWWPAGGDGNSDPGRGAGSSPASR